MSLTGSSSLALTFKSWDRLNLRRVLWSLIFLLSVDTGYKLWDTPLEGVELNPIGLPKSIALIDWYNLTFLLSVPTPA